MLTKVNSGTAKIWGKVKEFIEHTDGILQIYKHGRLLEKDLMLGDWGREKDD